MDRDVEDLPLGLHLVSKRTGYDHHGIYVGEGVVIHYAGGSNDPNAAGSKVQLIGLEDFAAGGNIESWAHPAAKFNGAEIAERAKRRLDENCYSVFSNNCEHFCNWAIYGEHASAQVDKRTAQVTGLMAFVPGRVGTLAITAIGAASGLAGGAAIMKGLAIAGSLAGGAVGGIASIGLGTGLAAATAANKTVLAKNDAHSAEEADARQIGRVASVVGAAGTTFLTIGAISAGGAVSGLSAAGITSGLAALGGTVGGGMAAGTAIAVGAPAVAAIGTGYLTYKAMQNTDQFRDGVIDTGERASAIASAAAQRAAEVGGPIAQHVASQAGDAVVHGAVAIREFAEKHAPVMEDTMTKATDVAKSGLRSMLAAVESGAAKLKQRLDDDGTA